jgi:hypothetical protein
MLQAPVSAQQIALRHFDIADGLGSLSVGAMMLDTEGFIWAGTESGVFRYNGRSFERQGTGSPLADATIRAIGQQQGGAGTIFISTPAEIPFAPAASRFVCWRAPLSRRRLRATCWQWRKAGFGGSPPPAAHGVLHKRHSLACRPRRR